VSSVFSLTANCSSLTVNLVVTLRKFLSLLLSVIYFDNNFTAFHWLGTFLVFTGTLLFTGVPSLCYNRHTADAVVDSTISEQVDAVTQQSVPSTTFTDNVIRRRTRDYNVANEEYAEANRCSSVSASCDCSDKMLQLNWSHVAVTGSDAGHLHEKVNYSLAVDADAETILTCRVLSDSAKGSELSSDGDVCDGHFKSS